MTFKNLLAILLVLSCVDAKQFGASAGDKSQKRGQIAPAVRWTASRNVQDGWFRR
jgi:hypothetical protein